MTITHLKYGKKILLLALFGLTCGMNALQAQTIVTDSVDVKFLQSKSVLNPDLDDNKANLDKMIKVMKERADSADLYHLRHIKVIGSASPEGSVEINRSLSQKRANSIFDYIGERVPLGNTPTVFEFIGRDWKGLYKLVLEDPQVPFRAEVLQLLSPVVQADSVTPAQSDLLLRNLKNIHDEKPYLYLYTHLFPKLRDSRLAVEYEFLNPIPAIADTLPVALIEEIPDPVVIEQEIVTEPVIPVKTCRPFYMGLKTNMLSGALLLPNIGAEFYLGRNWSVVGNWTYGWWDRNNTHWYWRGYGGDLAVRKWFGAKADDKPLTGHHLGAYAGVLTYDFEFGGVGHMGGRPGHSLWDRCLFTAGIEYGYSMPIARRLNLDFTLGVGYISGKIVKYHPVGDKYLWDSTRNFKGVLPTKLEISLVWLIGCDNYNR